MRKQFLIPSYLSKWKHNNIKIKLIKIKAIATSKFIYGYKTTAYKNQNNLTKVLTPYFIDLFNFTNKNTFLGYF